MKRLKFRSLAISLMFVASVFVFNSCGVESSLVGYDDIYADDEQIAFEEQNYLRSQDYEVYQDKRYTHQPQQYREQINTDVYQDTVINENFDMDDYYDYAYTARLHRFHDPAPIYSYYDDYYTNLYWYDRDYLLFGTSIYYGYRWWWPSYSVYWGWGWNPWRYHGWYGSWWGWHYGYYDYAWGWGWYGGPHHHHWGHHPHYYNSHDRNSGFYRPEHEGGRLTRANARGNSPSSPQNSTMSRGGNNQTFGERYNQRYGNSAITRGNSSTITRQSATSSSNSVTRANNRLQKPVSRSTNGNINRGNSSINNNNSTVNRNNSNVNRSNNTVNRNSNVNQSTRNRTYIPPAQRQQRSSTTYRSTPSNRSSNVNRSSNMNTSRSKSVSSSRSSSSRSSSISSGSRSSSSGSRGGSSSRSGGGRR